jgi:cobalt-zinc-cadmium efflux system outer membrane protein
MNIRSRTLVATSMAAMTFAVTGCVSIPKDRGAAEMQPLLDARSSAGMSSVRWPSERSACDGMVPQEPLTADAAVGIALRCSPRLQSLYAELALTQADVYEATRLSNPQLGFAQLATGAPDDIVNTTWSISQRFVELMLLPVRQRVGRETLLASQQHAAHEVLQLEQSVRAAYVTYVAAVAIAEMQLRAATAADLSAQTASAFHAAGNISELQLSREQATAIEVKLEHGKAKSAAARARADLLSVMGLPSRDAATLIAPTSLPVPLTLAISQPSDADALRKSAQDQRLDLQAARQRVTALDGNLSQQSIWRWFGDFEVGYERESETNESIRSGPTAAIGIPLFNTRKDLVLRAKGQLELAQVELRKLEIELDNDTEAAMEEARNARDASEALRDQLVPLRERITALSQREFNYMFIGAFELLAVKRDELQTYRHYLEAVRDEWLTQIQLQRIAGGKLPASLLMNKDAGVQP